ncbi:MAG: DinB family protein [Saprospiraceae bacterium]
MIKRPKKDEYPPYHAHYLDLVPPRAAAHTLLKRLFKEARELFLSIPEEFGELRYDEHKWNIKEVLLHLIDTERVFGFRILYFIRGDRIGMPGFNQDFWMAEVDVSNRTIKDLMNEWKIVRENTNYLLQQCTDEKSTFQGKATGWIVTPRALFFIIIGHQVHHMKVIREKYLPLIQSESPDENSIPDASQEPGEEIVAEGEGKTDDQKKE